MLWTRQTMKSECISRHEKDIIFLQMKKKLLLKQVAEIEREILIVKKFNRELKEREGKNEYKNF